MVNLSKLSTLFAYDLTSVTYKPIPGMFPQNSTSVANSTSVSYNASSSVGSRSQLANSGAHTSPAISSNTLSTHEALTDNDVYNLPSFSTSAEHNPVPSLKQELTSDTSSASNCQVESYDAPTVEDQEFPPYDQTESNVYHYRQQQSVNLGSWFVHEDWMTPSLFKCAAGSRGAELDIASGWGSLENARALLERHWDTFITQSDFDYLANIGINTVRLPIGYWNFGLDYVQGTAFEAVGTVYQNCWPRVVRAINQAGKAGLGVLVDLHGAPGSQNGQPHSGISDGQTHLFDVPGNMDKTLNVLTFLAKTLAPVNNVVGIQLLNEPQYNPSLESFYTRSIEAIRETSPLAKRLPLYLHDGFDTSRFSKFVAARTDFVVQDHHSYFVFTSSDKAESGSQHLVDVNGTIADSLLQTAAAQRRNLVVDEWSCALTPESLQKDKNADAVQKQFGVEQMRVYGNATAGWAFWSYKKEDCDNDPGWCFKAAVGKLLPDTFFSFVKSTSMKEASALAKEASNIMIPTDDAAGILNLVPQERFSYPAQGYPHVPHRFTAIHSHSRRDQQTNQAMHNSTTRGYKDGITTAKVFAAYNMSRLGFIGQYMADAIEVAGPSLIVQGTENGYRGGFMQGLQYGEAAVMTGQLA